MTHGGKSSLRGSRDFQWLLWGRSCSVLGGSMTALALTLLTLRTTGSPASASFAMAAQLAGHLVMGLPAGSLADRWGGRRTMVATSLCAAALLAVIPVLSSLRIPVGTAGLGIIACALGVVSSFHGPAEQCALKQVLDDSQLGAAMALTQARGSAAGIIGPPLAAACFALSPTLPLAADCVLNIVAAAAVSRARGATAAQDVAAPAPLTGLLDGIRWVRRDALGSTIVLVILVANLGFGAMFTVLTLDMTLRHGSGATARMQMLAGLGGVLGAAAAPWLLARVRGGVLFLGGLAGNVLIAAIVVADHDAWHVALLMALACLILPPGMAAVQGQLFATVPKMLQGRVSAAVGVTTSALLPLGTAAAGLCLQAWGRTVALCPFLFLVGLSMILAAAARPIRQLAVPA